MKSKGPIYEFIIKAIYFLFAFIAGILVVKSILDMLPLFKSFSYTEDELYQVISTTQVGKIYSGLGIVDFIDSSIVGNTLVQFIRSISGLAIIFLLLTLVMLFIYFMFVKWDLVGKYLLVSAYVILIYIAKFILFAISILLFFKNDLHSLALSLVIGTSLFTILSIIEFAILCYFIARFVLDTSKQIKLLTVN